VDDFRNASGQYAYIYLQYIASFSFPRQSVPARLHPDHTPNAGEGQAQGRIAETRTRQIATLPSAGI
jgi:hypothetical protein